MSKLHLDTLTVQSFVTSDGSSAAQPATQPGISDGAECGQTLYLSCDTCKCHTVDYNCG